MQEQKNAFLLGNAENEDFNQYWYSAATIGKLVQEITATCKRVAFLSTPSLYFSLPKGSEVRSNSWVFDLDERWAKEPRFCRYDFNKPEDLPPNLHHTFDTVVIDPPFITREVWEKYALAAKTLLQEGGKVIASTVAENQALMEDLLGATPCVFKPSIPHLVYQYNLFVNYDAESFKEKNPEIPDDD